MIERIIEIKNDIGLHSRYATSFVKKANEFKSMIQIIKEDDQADAKDILEILALGIVKGSKIKLIVSGTDEDTAMERLSKFLTELN